MKNLNADKIIWTGNTLDELRRLLGGDIEFEFPEIMDRAGLDYPWPIIVKSVEAVSDPAGGVWITIVLAFDEIPDATQYEVRFSLINDEVVVTLLGGVGEPTLLMESTVSGGFTSPFVAARVDGTHVAVVAHSYTGTLTMTLIDSAGTQVDTKVFGDSGMNVTYGGINSAVMQSFGDNRVVVMTQLDQSDVQYTKLWDFQFTTPGVIPTPTSTTIDTETDATIGYGPWDVDFWRMMPVSSNGAMLVSYSPVDLSGLPTKTVTINFHFLDASGPSLSMSGSLYSYTLNATHPDNINYINNYWLNLGNGTGILSRTNGVVGVNTIIEKFTASSGSISMSTLSGASTYAYSPAAPFSSGHAYAWYGSTGGLYDVSAPSGSVVLDSTVIPVSPVYGGWYVEPGASSVVAHGDLPFNCRILTSGTDRWGLAGEGGEYTFTSALFLDTSNALSGAVSLNDVTYMQDRDGNYAIIEWSG